MKKIIWILFLIINSCICEWVLEWNDEFDGDHLDYDKWEVTNGQQDAFEHHFGEEVVSYSKNDSKNVRIINGLLVLTPFQEEFNGRPFSAATINSRKAFLYGRLDIRAAFPEGSLLKAVFVLIPRDQNYGNEGNMNGMIEIIEDQQKLEFYSSVYYGVNTRKLTWYLPDNYNLNEFQNYSLEWNRTQLTWRLNDEVYYTFELEQMLSGKYLTYGQPFDKEFYLSIRLQVYTISNKPVNLGSNYHKLWPCPSLLVDHVRLYRQSNYSILLENSSFGEEKTNLSRKELCAKVKKENYLIDELSILQYKYIWIVILPVLFVLILIGVFIISNVVKIKCNVLKNFDDKDNF